MHEVAHVARHQRQIVKQGSGGVRASPSQNTDLPIDLLLAPCTVSDVGRRVLKITFTAGLIAVIGIQWILLQSVAWTGMIIVYAQTATLREAVLKTFDGKHPCQLCKVVEKGKKAEQEKQSKRMRSARLDFFCGHDPVMVAQPPPFEFEILQTLHSRARFETPIVPPPRFV